MTAPLLTRLLQQEDYPAWKPLWDGYNAFYGRSGPTALPDSVTQTTWQRFFDPTEPMQALVAEQNGQLLGLAHILYHRSTTDIGPTCYLQDLFTSEQARGKGVGRALIEAARQQARAAGATRLYWLTAEDNHTARQLYDAVTGGCSGFLEYETGV
ncbi:MULTISPECIES: GNAT family N-acetyltransferase [unclassified Paludibacterium]|uniref:GNAT family N-acetyltransferase n=1 Tax=unclassified Paludibacterium TaxID=2618429 RepID=UPI001C03BD40|nr:GNAT family N-acetyltransferase [Paludibacterium sp. B53371]BEV71811.1 GNAT family N-acetyltransferase [Paludibacterium sp. THUN1379]